jgi:hypothetical protein
MKDVCPDCGSTDPTKVRHEKWGSTGSPLKENEANPKIFPHAGGCGGCREERRCNVCGAIDLYAHGRCTNGRGIGCGCHGAVCTPGGDTSPGHGFGYYEEARVQAAKKKAPA